MPEQIPKHARAGRFSFFGLYTKKGRIREMPTRYETAVDHLHTRDVEGALNFIRTSMKKPNAHSLSATLAIVKGMYYTKFGQPPGYAEAVAGLQAAIDATPHLDHDQARELLALTPSDRRNAIQRVEKTHREF